MIAANIDVAFIVRSYYFLISHKVQHPLSRQREKGANGDFRLLNFVANQLLF